jgi:hypothetical protein
VPIDAGERRYAEPLRAAALALREALPRGAEVVLLGSIATPKDVEVLVSKERGPWRRSPDEERRAKL